MTQMMRAPTTLPITMPAMAPFDRLLLELDAAAPVVPLVEPTAEEEGEEGGTMTVVAEVGVT